MTPCSLRGIHQHFGGKYVVSLFRQNFAEGTLFIFANHTHEMETKTRNKALNAYENSTAIYGYHFNCCDHGGNSLLDPGQERGNGAFQITHLTSIL